MKYNPITNNKTLPEGWKLLELKNLSNYISRGKQPKYVDGSSCYVLNQKAIQSDGIKKEFLRQHDPQKVVDERHFIKKNDIVINSTGTGTVGRVYHFMDVPEEKLFTDTHVTTIRIKENKVLPRFLYYQLVHTNYQRYILRTFVSGSTGQVELNKSSVEEFPIIFPSIQKQYQIIKPLMYLDQKIKLNNSIIANLEELAQTLFKRWFVDFEFPNEEGEPYKSNGGKMVESELGMIPEGWNLNKLNEISKLIMGLSPKSSTYNEEGEGLPLLNGAADFDGSSLAPKRYTSDPKRISIKSDLILCIRATIGNLTYSDSEYALGRGVAAIRPYKREYSELLYHFVLRSINRLKAQATGSVISGLSKPDLENIIILVPNDKKLNEFHNVFSSIQLKQQQLSEENIRLINIRDTLLPKLLSGEIELPDGMEVTDDVPIS